MDVIFFTFLLPLAKYIVLFIVLYFIVKKAVLEAMKAANKQLLQDKDNDKID